MSKVKINKDKFLKFLNLCALKGELENKDILLNFEDKLVTAIANKNRIVVFLGTLKEEFENLSEVGIQNLDLLKSFINSLTDNVYNTKEISIKKLENKLVFESGKTKYSSVLLPAKYFKDKTTYPNSNYVEKDKVMQLIEKCNGNEFILKSIDVKKLISAFNSISSSSFILTGKDNFVMLKLENQSNELEITFDITEKVQPFTTKLTKQIIDILNVISDFDIKFSIKSDNPISLKVVNDDIDFTYVIAPMSKNNVEGTKTNE